MDKIEKIEFALKKRTEYPYNWGRKQLDDWDKQTNFIYQTYSFVSLVEKTKNFDQDLKNYVFNRWYNYWSAMAVEHVFSMHSIVKANKNKYDKLIDFSIKGIPFDHKTSVFPKAYYKSIEHAMANKKELILWLYQNQSQQGRKHLENRLFLVLYNAKGAHWKMKAEIGLLKNAVDVYINDFDQQKLTKLNFGNGPVLSDIIWVRK